ncbi:prolipoprotein diacylglyceryl transferase [Boseaceae bacterium BT-24-1]|nr:prolipoprotein diacylglyceryl transferase [Boseaceae bacterium BT-24-1]
MNPVLGKTLYGALFTIAWPGALALFAARLDALGFVTWPIPFPRWVWICLCLPGAALMASAMLVLVRHGEGLPMNAYPTKRLVTGAIYRWMAHPIYVGFVLCVLGVSVLAESRGGFWFAAPLAGLAAAALVAGWEGPALRARFGQRPRPPMLGLPAEGGGRVTLAKRIWICVATLGAWSVAYTLLATMPVPSGAASLDTVLDGHLPRSAVAVWVYSLAYLYALAGPIALVTGAELRRFFASAWVINVVGFAIMLLLPGLHAFPPNSYEGTTGWLMDLNQTIDAPWLAFPSFHVAWTALSTACLAHRWPKWRPIWAAATLAVAFSCLATGAHALVDVVGGYVLAVAAWKHAQIWAALVRASERLSNSLTLVEIGPVRVLSHAVWSWVAAFAAILTVVLLAGPGEAPRALAVFLVGVVAAGAWGYWLEGGTRLSRPFGYFGFLLGAGGCLCVLWFLDPARGGTLAAAFATGAPLAQGLGRARCLVQGCCHGRPVTGVPGIRVVHPQSRVTQLAGLACVAIHPTPLYSALANAAIFAVLLRLWSVQAPAALIVCIYLVLSSLARFVEEEFRGEPQTPSMGSLNVYQWMAVSGLPLGMAVIALPSVPLPAAAGVSLAAIGAAAAAGTVAAIAMSVDLPRSTLPFSKLTVCEGLADRSGRQEPDVEYSQLSAPGAHVGDVRHERLGEG